jgi:VWFA-related protein
MDVTVLDRNGRPVLDLTLDDFELTEDGTRQQVVVVTSIQRGVPLPRIAGSAGAVTGQTTATPPPGVTANAPPDDEPSSVTAILLDHVSAEGRAAARAAALTYVSTLVSPRDQAGVFVADLSLKTLQPFTNDAGRLRQAIDRMVMVASPNLADAQRLKGQYATALDPSVPVTASAESSQPGFVSGIDREKRLKSLDPVERMLALIEVRMEEGFRQITAEFSGDVSLAGIGSVIDALGSLRGRKSVLYFAETLDITSRLKPRLEHIIGLANRNNVTLYTVDAAGLRVHSKEAEVGRNVAVAGAQGTGDATRTDGAWTKELERQEQVLSSRPSAVLGRLAKETGGFHIENTNNLGAGINRIQQERANYYLLGYQSTKSVLDGKFRRVSVKVKRPGVTVKMRSGYLAVPSRTP